MRGFPTVAFADSKGKEVAKLRSRSADAVKAQILEVAEKYGAKLYVEMGIDEAKTAAKEKGKLLAVVFVDAKDRKRKKKNAIMNMVLLSSKMDKVRERYIWIKRPLKDGKKVTDEAKSLKAKSSPTVVVIDPFAEGDGHKVLKKFTKGKKIWKHLKKVADKAEKKRTK